MAKIKCYLCGAENSREPYQICTYHRNLYTASSAEIVKSLPNDYVYDPFAEEVFPFDDLEAKIKDGDYIASYIFCCEEHRWDGIDVDKIIEDCHEEYGDTFHDDIVDLGKLRDFIFEWNSKQTKAWYYTPDRSKVYLLDEKQFFSDLAEMKKKLFL